MYAAIDEQDLSFHFVHESDGSRIGYQKVCKAEDRPVDDDEIVKAYELEDGSLVYMSEQDFEAAESEGFRAIEVVDFVPYEQIDPIYFERTFYLGPQDGAEKVYELFVEALQHAGLAAVARYVFHDRQQLGCLRVRDGVITLEKMYFADEVRPLDGIRPERRPRVDERELDMALSLVDRFATDFDITRYEDEYRARLLKIIEQKRKGKQVRAPRPEEPEATVDLVAALRESLERVKRGRGSRSSTGSRRRAAASDDLTRRTLEELRQIARERGIRGHSRMKKAELAEAVRRVA
jgi:DNA end-binding protein Ku